MTPLRLMKDPILRSELAALAEAGFGDMVKAVVDVRRGVMGNRSREVEDETTRDAIRAIVARLVTE